MNRKLIMATVMFLIVSLTTVSAYALNQQPLQTDTSIDQKQTYPYPQVTGYIEGGKLAKLLNEKFNGTRFYSSDTQYALTTLEQAQKYTAGCKIGAYVPEGHDCENYAYQLLGYWSEGNTSFAFGLLIGMEHAGNFFVDDKLDVYIIESQTHAFMPVDHALDVGSNGKYVPVMLLC